MAEYVITDIKSTGIEPAVTMVVVAGTPEDIDNLMRWMFRSEVCGQPPYVCGYDLPYKVGDDGVARTVFGPVGSGGWDLIERRLSAAMFGVLDSGGRVSCDTDAVTIPQIESSEVPCG